MTEEIELPQHILDARAKYVESNLDAERIERAARRARRRAARQLAQYQRLLMEFQGQERLPFEETP